MRALGPGSVSSFLKIMLDVVYGALWIGLAIVGLLVAASLTLIVDPNLLAGVTLTTGGEDGVRGGPAVTADLAAAAAYGACVLVIVAQLRRIFGALTAGDPFHPDNVRRLRAVGLILAGLEIGRYVFWALTNALISGTEAGRPSFSPTAWFSVLVVFVLAEVFREGARLRREAELTI